MRTISVIIISVVFLAIGFFAGAGIRSCQTKNHEQAINKRLQELTLAERDLAGQLDRAEARARKNLELFEASQAGIAELVGQLASHRRAVASLSIGLGGAEAELARNIDGIIRIENQLAEYAGYNREVAARIRAYESIITAMETHSDD